jgi:RNA polymerase II subunit A small phosphatase-like protein
MATVRTLLVLDLDETLIYATAQAMKVRKPDFAVGPFVVYRRPDVETFLGSCSERFELAVWSAGDETYVRTIVERLAPAGVEFAFLWGRERCTRQWDVHACEDCFLKDLRKVKRRGFSLERMLIVEDDPRKVKRHYGNAIYVRPYYGQLEDGELSLLAKYLSSIDSVPNVRTLEKRDWRLTTRRHMS